MKLSSLTTALSVLLLSPLAASQDAFTIRQSDARVKLRASLTSGGPVVLTAYDGELSTVQVDGRKVGITVRIADRETGSTEVRFFELTRGRNGAEVIRAIETAEGKVGETVAAIGDTIRQVLTTVEIVEILGAPASVGADTSCPNAGKCCVTCGHTTVCSYCAVFHDCGSCCTCGCC